MAETRIAWLACAVAILAGGACRSGSAAAVTEAAERYLRLARDLARHDPSLIDHWLVAPPSDQVPRQPVAVLRAAADDLAADLDALGGRRGDDGRRVRYLTGQVQALQLAARRLLGESLPFDVEARLGLGVVPAPPHRLRTAEARARIEIELPGSEPLAVRLARFRARFVVPDARRAPTLQAALAACRTASAAAGPLPSGEGVEVAFVPGLRWDAHTQYLGGQRSRIEVDASHPLDLTRTLRLACHEGYPGHHLQYLWISETLVAGRGWPEFALVPGFGPHLLLAEGAAEIGVDLAMPASRRIQVYREVLAPAAGLTTLTDDDFSRLVRIEQWLIDLESVIADVAREYLDDRINARTAERRLAEEALTAAPESLVAFIERRRSRLLAYTEGRRLVHTLVTPHGLGQLQALFTSRALTTDASRDW